MPHELGDRHIPVGQGIGSEQLERESLLGPEMQLLYSWSDGSRTIGRLELSKHMKICGGPPMQVGLRPFRVGVAIQPALS